MKHPGIIFEKIYRWLVIMLFTIMVTATIMQVIFRYFIRYPLGWTEELSRIMFVWSAFLSIGLLASQNRLLKVDAVINYLPPQLRLWADMLTKLLSGIFVFWLGVLGLRLLKLAQTQLSPALRIPYWYIYLSLPVGMFFASGYMLTQSVRKFLQLRKGGQKT